MKQKTFYILAIVCCLSLFSSAKQSGKKCDPTVCKAYKLKSVKQALPKATDRYAYDLSPLTFFINM